MLNKTTLTDDSVSTFFDMIIWLTAQYGPPIKHAVPKILNPDMPLHMRCWEEDDPRPVFAWAEAEAAYLSSVCMMEGWSVQVAPNGNKAQSQNLAIGHPSERDAKPSLTPLKSTAWSADKYPGYFVDYFGRPTFFYDPRRCKEAGYFAKTLLPQFALLKIYAKHPPAEFGEKSIEQLVQMTACHMGLGFTMLVLSQSGTPKNWMPLNLMSSHHADADELPYLYGTLITLAAHRLNQEQIIATYGQLMTQRTRKILGAAYAQIHAQPDVLKLLKMLAKPIRSARPEYNHHHQAQASNGPV